MCTTSVIIRRGVASEWLGVGEVVNFLWQSTIAEYRESLMTQCVMHGNAIVQRPQQWTFNEGTGPCLQSHEWILKVHCHIFFNFHMDSAW